MRTRIAATYEYVLTLPDRLYPFAREVEGQWVRGRRSYEQALDEALKKYGDGRFGYKLTLYREVFHFIGSVLFISTAAIISHVLFGSDVALYVLLISAVIALSYQEFYLHPKYYDQHTPKGVTDWLTWIAPMIVYLFFFSA